MVRLEGTVKRHIVDDDDKSSLFSYASLAYDEPPIIKLPILPFRGLQTTPFLQNLQILAEVFATD